jgi:hypothetical protein
MSKGRNVSPLGTMGDVDMPALVYPQLRVESAAVNLEWITHMILATKTVMAGAEFIPCLIFVWHLVLWSFSLRQWMWVGGYSIATR